MCLGDVFLLHTPNRPGIADTFLGRQVRFYSVLFPTVQNRANDFNGVELTTRSRLTLLTCLDLGPRRGCGWLPAEVQPADDRGHWTLISSTRMLDPPYVWMQPPNWTANGWVLSSLGDLALGDLCTLFFEPFLSPLRCSRKSAGDNCW